MMRPAAGILLVRGDGKIFLMRRSANVPVPNHWNVPGGGIEAGETAFVAAAREFREEAGSLPRARPIGMHTIGPYTTFVAAISMHEAAHWYPRMNAESNDWGWFSMDRLPVPLHPGLADFFARVQLS
jgi:8-oxo-dGTP pyrophosphatase MutT (NUDIX family)